MTALDPDHLVSPEAAAAALDAALLDGAPADELTLDLLATVASEPARIKSEYVSVTRSWAGWLRDVHGLDEIAETMEMCADAVEAAGGAL